MYYADAFTVYIQNYRELSRIHVCIKDTYISRRFYTSVLVFCFLIVCIQAVVILPGKVYITMCDIK